MSENLEPFSIAERIKALFGPIDKLKTNPFGISPKYEIDENSFDEEIGYFKIKSLQNPQEDLEYLLIDKKNKVVAHRAMTTILLEENKVIPSRTMIEYTDGVIVGRYMVNYDNECLPQSIIVALSPILKGELTPIDLHATAVIFLDNKVSTVGISYGNNFSDWRKKEAIFQIEDDSVLLDSGSAKTKLEPGVSFFPGETKPYGYMIEKNSTSLDLVRIDSEQVNSNWHLSVQKIQDLQALDKQMRGDITEWSQVYKTLEIKLLIGKQLFLSQQSS